MHVAYPTIGLPLEDLAWKSTINSREGQIRRRIQKGHIENFKNTEHLGKLSTPEISVVCGAHSVCQIQQKHFWVCSVNGYFSFRECTEVISQLVSIWEQGMNSSCVFFYRNWNAELKCKWQPLDFGELSREIHSNKFLITCLISFMFLSILSSCNFAARMAQYFYCFCWLFFKLYSSFVHWWNNTLTHVLPLRQLTKQ